MSLVKILSDPVVLTAVFEQSCEWADKITVCTPFIDADSQTSATWIALNRHLAKVQRCLIVDRAGPSEPLRILAAKGVLRLIQPPKGQGRFRLNFTLFQRDDEVRLLVGSARFLSARFGTAAESVVRLDGPKHGPVACSLFDLIEQSLEHSRVPLPGEFSEVPESGELESVDVETVNEDLSVEPTGSPFLEIEDRWEQVEAVRACLLGLGPLSKDVAIRRAATTLRSQGMLVFKRLRKEGAIYSTLFKTIEFSIRDGQSRYFDRPKKGMVRAVCRTSKDCPAALWKLALESVLTDDWTARCDLVELAAGWAVTQFGLEYQRLRTGGVIDLGIRSAIEEGIRIDAIEAFDDVFIRRLIPVANPTTEDLPSIRSENHAESSQAIGISSRALVLLKPSEEVGKYHLHEVRISPTQTNLLKSLPRDVEAD